MNQWLFRNSLVSTVLANRPLALEWFERHGMDPFPIGDQGIGEACADHGIAWETFLAELEALGEAGRNSDWQTQPIARLIDFLTREHREFTGEWIPAIQSAMNAGDRDSERPVRLDAMIRMWPEFKASLIQHMTAEESFLFPKLLRYDYCGRHRVCDPGFAAGSVKVFAALHLLREEHRQAGSLRDFLEAAGFAEAEAAKDSAWKRHRRLLSDFQARLTEHSRIEREILYPRAVALEKRMYDGSISGKSHPPSSAGRQ